jgi:hypothetical protein
MSQEFTTGGGSAPGAPSCEPTRDEVENLITRAREHPLGLEFLEFGALDAVAAIHGAHAFVVDAAREYLARARPRSDT